jgi:NADH-quinone oxidoreductase subunit H
MHACCICWSPYPGYGLSQGKSELVAGFFTEHSAISFACFFLGEYTNMVTISTLFSILYLGLLYLVTLTFPYNWTRELELED